MLEEIKREVWNITAGPLEYDVAHLNTLLSRLEESLRLIVCKKARIEYLNATSTLWLPFPNIIGGHEYDSGKYNSQEALCLAIRTVIL